MESFDEKLYEFIQDITCNEVISSCCGAMVLYPDICSDCKEHCNPLYLNIRCDCGGFISSIDNYCEECNKEYKQNDIK